MDAHANQNVIHTLNQQARFISKSLNTQLKKHHLFSSQWVIVYCLHKFGVMTQTDIWKYVNVEAPTITRTLAKMEQNGWITRTQGTDKRERIIELTTEAQKQFPLINESVTQLEEDLLGNLTPDEKKQLQHLLKKIGQSGE